MTVKLDLQYSKTMSYAKFQLNMSKHVREKLKNCVFSVFEVRKGAYLLQKLRKTENFHYS